jgi:glucose-6-phosphate dehydrogenase assembly protein OpcA
MKEAEVEVTEETEAVVVVAAGVVTGIETEDHQGKVVDHTMVIATGRVGCLEKVAVKVAATTENEAITMLTAATATTIAETMMVIRVAVAHMVVEVVGMVTSLLAQRMVRVVSWKVVEQEVVVEVVGVAMVMREKSAPREHMTVTVDQAEGMPFIFILSYLN